MLSAKIIADFDFVISPLDRRVFGAFVEHMGRCVYGGIYEPGHPTADKDGFRGDVLALARELGPTIVRYPGGNFLSGYNWEDGVGPREKRPARLDLAWGSTETNEFGTNEFMLWLERAGMKPMFAVNLGTRGPDEARRLIEYCNHPGGSFYSDLRRAHGVEQPHNIKFWCLGNEMDGPWQICAKTAREYGRVARETAKAMRWVDPDIQLAVCGSSHRRMPTYAAWEYEVLDECFEHVDYISLHQYFRNDDDDIRTYFTVIDDLNAFITEVAAIADAVAAKRRSSKRIMLSLDEWNVWYKAHGPNDLRKPDWPQAPPLIEEIYNFEDALIVGGVLIAMINNADRLKAACLAQLVNVIGPIMTETGGAAWRQTIFHPFSLTSKYAHGEALRLKVEAATFDAAGRTAPCLIASVVRDPGSGACALFALNRSVEDMSLECELRGLGTQGEVRTAIELNHPDLKAINTKEAPETVAPSLNERVSLSGELLRATLKPLSWNVVVLSSPSRSRP
jgi:alpha-N-arabinofuranosidase